MKEIPSYLEDKIYAYMDGQLTGSEKEAFEHLLASDKTVKSRYDEIVLAERLLTEAPLLEPSPGFTETVLERISNPPVRFSIRNGLIIFSAIVFLMFLLAGFASAGIFEQTTMVDLNKLVPLEEMSDRNIPSVSIDVQWFIRILIVLNTAVAFIVLDRTVLKPFFQQRHQSIR